MSDRRDPLEKERFMEGVRQKWAVIFLSLGIGVFIGNILVPAIDPVPFMQFLLAIGSLFILGASGDSWVKAYSVKSIRQTEVREETKRANDSTNSEKVPDKDTVLKYQEQFEDDPSYAPQAWIEKQTNSLDE